MNSLKRLFSVAVALLMVDSWSLAACCMPVVHKKPLVQVAILLDTSNSMDGLIEQAKSQLWRIANDLAFCSRYGERPTLEVSLYEYGNDWLSPGENYIRQVLPFTTDMDLVSQQLFSLRTHGGQEYTGAVIKDAVNNLRWDTRNDVYKVIFIAGNEPFTQGPVYYRDAISLAARKGILVNTIFCGAYAEGVQTQWYDGAMVGRGAYLTIDQNRTVMVDPTPYDPEIGRLGMEINRTFVGYGVDGQAALKRRAGVNQLAESMAKAGTATERALYAATPQYSMNNWDAVGGVASGRMKVAEIKSQNLPVELQSKSKPELEAYLKDQQDKRTSLQKRLMELQKSREDLLAKRQQQNGTMSLDQAMRKAIREQAGKLNFAFGGVQ